MKLNISMGITKNDVLDSSYLVAITARTAKTKPKNAEEFKKEQAKKRREAEKRKEKGAMEEVAKSFRLK